MIDDEQFWKNEQDGMLLKLELIFMLENEMRDCKERFHLVFNIPMDMYVQME
jgi:hypothetical protein